MLRIESVRMGDDCHRQKHGWSDPSHPINDPHGFLLLHALPCPAACPNVDVLTAAHFSLSFIARKGFRTAANPRSVAYRAISSIRKKDPLGTRGKLSLSSQHALNCRKNRRS
jgi:hypothetical protein